jgi:hypothetical protein
VIKINYKLKRVKTNISTLILAFQIVDLSVFSNTSKQESNSFDDLIRTPPLIFETTGITDEQQSKTLLTISKRYSRPKILVEDIQCK